MVLDGVHVNWLDIMLRLLARYANSCCFSLLFGTLFHWFVGLMDDDDDTSQERKKQANRQDDTIRGDKTAGVDAMDRTRPRTHRCNHRHGRCRRFHFLSLRE